MPCAYHVDPRRRAVFIRSWGTLTEDEARITNGALQEDPRFDPGFVRLENLTAVTAWAIGAPFIRVVAERHRALTTPKRAFVVASDAGFGMARMLQMFADASPATFLVTRDADEAFRWVGLDPAEGWPVEPPAG